jgi:hypothetical protein
MKMRSWIACLGFAVFILLFLQPVWAQEISSYEELFAMLPGGLDNLDMSKPVVEEAQKHVAERQMLRRRRVIKFIKPIRVDRMNEKYISVAFQSEIQPRKSAVFALLFETNGQNGISFPNTTYLSWVGSNDLKNFETLALDGLYKSYQEMGIADCTPGFMRSGFEKTLMGKADINHTHDASIIVSGTLPESVIPRSIARTSDLDRSMKLTVAKMEKRIHELERTVATLNTLLEGVSRKNGTIQFSNVNVQIVNGKGATDQSNGKGNLIVGYNESRGKDNRNGSHNLIIGCQNNYSSYGGIVSGMHNEIDGKFATVVGGNYNDASGDYASITGGAKNNAKGKYSSIHGQNGRTKVGKGENPHFQASDAR